MQTLFCKTWFRYPISMAFSQILKHCVFAKSFHICIDPIPLKVGRQKISRIRAGRCFWNERVKYVRGRGWSGRLGFLKLPVVETALCNTSAKQLGYIRTQVCYLLQACWLNIQVKGFVEEQSEIESVQLSPARWHKVMCGGEATRANVFVTRNWQLHS